MTLADLFPAVNRYLGIYFFYNHKCDSEYMAPGHEDCIVDQINFPDDSICKLETTTMRPYQDGVHAYVRARVSMEHQTNYVPASR